MPITVFKKAYKRPPLKVLLECELTRTLYNEKLTNKLETALFLITINNAVVTPLVSKFISMTRASATQEGRDKYGIKNNYYVKSTKASIDALRKELIRYENNVSKHFLRGSECEDIFERIANALDVTDEYLAPIVDALEKMVLYKLSKANNLVDDIPYNATALTALLMSARCVQCYDNFVDMFPFLYKSNDFSIFRYTNTFNQCQKSVNSLPTYINGAFKDNVIFQIGGDDIDFILDEFAHTLFSTELIDKIYIQLDGVDYKRRFSETRSFLDSYAVDTLPLVAYKQHYKNFDPEKFLKKRLG